MEEITETDTQTDTLTQTKTDGQIPVAVVPKIEPREGISVEHSAIVQTIVWIAVIVAVFLMYEVFELLRSA